MSVWDALARWVTVALAVVLAFIAFASLAWLLEANPDNVLVAFTNDAAVVLLGPFEGMFGAGEPVLTALVAVVGYATVAGIVLLALRALRVSAAARRSRGAVLDAASEPVSRQPGSEGGGG